MAHHTEDHGAGRACVECEVPQLARNHYFTGKLLVERDFTDEQRYFMGKDRRHNQRLHGWGTVCGLKVVQHPNPACRSKYVIVEPGYALDCCGREIIVHREDTFDFRSRVEGLLREQLQEEDDEIDPELKHKLQICIRYKECAAEDVPALFDECGCDDNGCMPNRVLESYALDVILDAPAKKPCEAKKIGMTWVSTIGVNLAQALALDQSAKKLWVGGVVSTNEARAYAFSSENQSLVTMGTIKNPREVAVSTDGTRLYTARGTTGSPFEVDVFDAAAYGPAATPIRTVVIPGGQPEGVTLATSSDGKVYAYVQLQNASANSHVVIYDKELATKLADVTVGKGGGAIAISSDGKQVFATNAGDGTVMSIDPATFAATTILTAAGVKFSRVAVTSTVTDTRLALADMSTKKLYLYKFSGGSATALGDPFTLAGEPRDLLFSPGGGWIYAHVDDASKKSSVFAIDAHAIELKKAQTPASVATGDRGGELAVTANGGRIYAAYFGPANIPNPGDPLPLSGGVAVIDVVEHDCKTLIDGIIEKCPSCDADECIVLATIDDYTFGSDVTDDEIDNLTDRKLLPSTAVLTKVVQCLLEKGGTGTQGPQGVPGPAGPAGPIGLTGPAGQAGPTGPAGPAGPAAPVLELPRIVAISWPHGGNLVSPGGAAPIDELLVAFENSRPVKAVTIHAHSFEVYIRTRDTAELPFMTFNYSKIDGIVDAIQVEADCASERIRVIDPQPVVNGAVTGARFRPRDRNGRRTRFIPGEYVVLIDGNFILGHKPIVVNGKEILPALDGNHFAPGIRGTLDGFGPRCPSGDGIEGGTFRSWFTIGVDIQ